MIKEQIERWLTKRTAPVSVAEIAKRFKCHVNTARLVATRLWMEKKVSVCIIDSSRHFSKQRTCPPCNHNCNEGRQCPSRKTQ